MLRRKYLRLLGFLVLLAAMAALNAFDPPNHPPSGNPVDIVHRPGEEGRHVLR
ncbi:MAG TPA: hypothetical protein VK465_09180 [Fibrobacteria bacterium]|nr:hypothetical protein [Fibrobacteria bacterium]